MCKKLIRDDQRLALWRAHPAVVERDAKPALGHGNDSDFLVESLDLVLAAWGRPHTHVSHYYTRKDV